jgi:hypothetical protein
MRRVLVPLVLVLLAGCASTGAPQAAQRQSATPSPEQVTETPVTAPTEHVTETPTPTPQNLGLLDFSVPAVGGGQVDGAALAGGDVALWFWAPW